MTLRTPSQRMRVQNEDMPDPADQHLTTAFQPAPQGDHILSEDGWERFLEGTMTALERDGVSSHLASCRECAAVYKGLREFEAKATEFDPEAPGPVPRVVPLVEASPRNRWIYSTGVGLALAASLAIGVGLIRGRANPAQFRGGDTTENRVSLVPPDGAPDAQGRISWSPVPGAAAYSVTVFAEDGRVVSRSKVMGATSAPWPPEASGPGIYFWRVSVAGEDDREGDSPPIVSSLARVEIRP